MQPNVDNTARLADTPLRSVYTSTLPEIFAQLNISLIVSTYQAGKVILVRRDTGAATNGHGPTSTMNTHFRSFHKPMGIAVQARPEGTRHGAKLAIGGQKTVWELHNMPALARKLEPTGKHDACYLPRRIHITGDIDIHGPLAFISLSQVRESATFSGLPLMDRLGEERTCGVWVVHIETGQTLGFLRFESGVQEIFAVQVLPNARFPEMLEWDDEQLAHSYVLPDAALAETHMAEVV